MGDQEAQNNSEMKKVASLSQLRQFFSTQAASLGPLSLGTVLAWTLDRNVYPEPTKEQYTLLFAMPLIGGFLSGPIGGVLIEKFGRKRIMLLASMFLLIGWVLVGFGHQEIIIVTYAGRFLTGFGGGTSLLAAIAYISEFADAKRRGFLLCFVQIMLLFGDLFINFISNLGIRMEWIAYMCGIFPLIYLILTIFARESPHYLVNSGKIDDAKRSISWFRGTTLQDYAAKEELEAISRSADAANERKPGCCGRVFIRPIFKPLSLAVHCVMMVQMCGVSIILEERTKLLQNSGLIASNNYVMKVVLDLLMILSTVFTAFIVDGIGRRTLFILSGLCMSANLVALGTFYYVNQEKVSDGVTSLDYGWIPIVSTFLFLVGFSLGVGPLPWVLIGELVAPGSKGYCLAPLVSIWFLNTFFVSSDLDMSRKFELHVRLWIFGGVCLFGTLQILCTLPETKKKSLEKIEEFFASKKSYKSANTSTLTVQTLQAVQRPESTSLLTPPDSNKSSSNNFSKWEYRHRNGNGKMQQDKKTIAR